MTGKGRGGTKPLNRWPLNIPALSAIAQLFMLHQRGRSGADVVAPIHSASAFPKLKKEKPLPARRKERQPTTSAISSRSFPSSTQGALRRAAIRKRSCRSGSTHPRSGRCTARPSTGSGFRGFRRFSPTIFACAPQDAREMPAPPTKSVIYAVLGLPPRGGPPRFP